MKGTDSDKGYFYRGARERLRLHLRRDNEEMRKPHETFQAEGTPGANAPEMTSQRSWSRVGERVRAEVGEER